MGHIRHTIFYITNDPERALGLEILLPNYHIICIDDNPIIDYIVEKGGKVFCLERELGKTNPIFRNSNRLINEKVVQQYIDKNTPPNEAPKVMFFKIAKNIEKTCERLNYRVLNSSSELNKRFETKISQYEMLKDEGVNFPTTKIGLLGDFNYDNLKSELGEDFVIQYSRGHTGSGTFFNRDEESFRSEQSLYPKREAKITRRIYGDSWTINACVSRFGILYGGLSYQITGISELVNREGGTVGNDWSQSQLLSEFSKEQIKKITEKVGKVMRRNRFKGLFGLDFIVDNNGEVFLIEVNARQPASTSVHTKYMTELGIIPMQIFHIAEYLYQDDEEYLSFLRGVFKAMSNTGKYKVDFDAQIKNEFDAVSLRKKTNEIGMESFNLSQVFYRNIESQLVKVVKSLKPGIYKYDKDLVWIRKGYSISDIINEDEFLLLSQSKGKNISPGNEASRIQLKSGSIDKKGNLYDWITKTLHSITLEKA